MGLGYRWNLDFVGPLNLMPQHNRYVLVMIEHFSKWLELVPLLNHNSERATYAFLDKVFSRFGVLVENFIDQSAKFQGDFQDLCEKELIDHHITSRDHLEVDGLAKQMMQMVKRRLQKYGLQKSHTRDWDL
jgi:hypothetical protein